MNIHSVYAIFQRWFRPRRMAVFRDLFQVRDSSRILDVGGHPTIWSYIPEKPQITLLNIDIEDSERDNLLFRKGDARNLPYCDNAFDIAYCNSVIEHVGGFETQKRVAEEIRRVAPRYYVQTPYRWFPVEPHFLAPFIHYLPKFIMRRLMFLGGHYWIAHPSSSEIDRMVDEIELLDVGQMQELFPDATILRERFFGLTKSLIAVRT